MKKLVAMFLILCAALSLSACNNSSKVTTQNNNVQNVINEQILSENDDTGEKVQYDNQKEQNTPDSSNQEAVDEENVDVDLTTMNSNMIYANVYDMLQNPDAYVGKTIKMNGIYVNFSSEDGSVLYPACLVKDATACCSQGIEFVLADGVYPEEGTEMVVIGTFNTYIDELDGYQYFHLENAKLL